jgi:hypothetical protein
MFLSPWFFSQVGTLFRVIGFSGRRVARSPKGLIAYYLEHIFYIQKYIPKWGRVKNTKTRPDRRALIIYLPRF